jgi:transcriptional regulator with XRE-family HTH domain
MAELDDISDRLKQLRESTKLDQVAFCRVVGIEPQAWNNYERGFRRISLDQALKICQATGASLDWIYRGIGKPVKLPASVRRQGP